MAAPMRFPVPLQTGSYVVSNIEVYYPFVYGMRELEAQERMNAAIQAQAGSMITDQQANQEGSGPTTITGLFEIKTNERGVLSLTQSNYAYTPPAAHGMTLLRSLTFEAATGKAYRLSELFQPGSAYIDRISAQVRAQIAERDVPLLGEFTEIAPDQSYYLADKALVVYYQLYELTPYVYGFPMFPISVYSLQDLLVENGPLGKMLPGV
ncbi:DUF3298 and DUF4163 domain-containing protein [Paenibacillus sp. TRM 82003]|nr:DUF3298 and DUF4163 domain-containing protein [Paenibacillus sp. TRM 82003]